MIKKLDWADFKIQADNHKASIQYAEKADGSYDLWIPLQNITYECLVLAGSSAETDFENNYKSAGNSASYILDFDGAPMSRTKMFKTGVAVRFHFFEITTSKYSGGYKHDKSDNSTDFGYITYKIYDNTDTEITSTANEGNAVKTVVDWEPPSINYEIVGGKFYQAAPPGSDVYVHVVGVPDIPEGSGGSIPFCSNANLKLMPAGVAFQTDGRVPKTMSYDATYHTSKLRIILHHSAGVQHQCMGELEIAH